jgi:hypothetical protein
MNKFTEKDLDEFFEKHKDLMEALARQEEKDKLKWKLNELKEFHAQLGRIVKELEDEIEKA